MKIMRYLSILLIPFFLLGCEKAKFALVADGTSGAYRMDLETGEVSLINPDGITKIKESVPLSAEAKTSLEETKYYRTFPIGKSDSEASVSFTTTWKDGMLYYAIEISPFRGYLTTHTSSINLGIETKNDLQLAGIKIPFSEMSVISEGGKVTGWAKKGSVLLSAAKAGTMDHHTINFSQF